MGAMMPAQAMSSVDTDTVIDLDAFPVAVQQRIVQQLAKGRCSRWVLFSECARKVNSGARKQLQQVGTMIDTLIAGQRGGAQDSEGKEAWRTGDTRVGALVSGRTV